MLRRNPEKVDRVTRNAQPSLAESMNDALPSQRAKPSLYSGWLPSLKSGGDVGWLPLRASSTLALIDAVTRGNSGVSTLAKTMQTDPALLMASAAFSYLENDSTSTIHFSQLAADWCQQGKTRWKATDWLACPDGEIDSSRFQRFVELDHYFQTIPIHRWLEQSDVWMEACFGKSPDFGLAGIKLIPDVDPSIHPPRSHDVIRRLVESHDQSDLTIADAGSEVEAARRDLAHSLAYGLSHEINNPLANISTRAQSLAMVVEDGDQKRSLHRIVDQTNRAHAMIADLMFYANPPSPRIQSFDLAHRIAKVLESVAETAQRNSIEVQLIEEANFQASPIDGDSEMIGEAVLTLIVNSIDAIGSDGRIEVRLHTFGDDRSVRSEIRVCDSGPGLSPEQAAKAFDPYFSGREAGRGLGLGLCRAQRIMQLHGGTVEIQPALAGCVATIAW